MSETLPLVREALRANGKSVRTMARELGINHSHLSRILAGRVGVGPGTIVRLMTLLDQKAAIRLLDSFVKDERERVMDEYIRMSREHGRGSRDI